MISDVHDRRDACNASGPAGLPAHAEGAISIKVAGIDNFVIGLSALRISRKTMPIHRCANDSHPMWARFALDLAVGYI